MVAQLLGGRLHEVSERLVAEIRADVAEYAGISPEVGRDQMRVVQRIAHGLVQAWLDREPLTDEALRLAREAGARRAQQGIPLVAVHSGLAVSRSVAWEYIASLAREALPADDVAEAIADMGGDLIRMVDEIFAAMTEGYLEQDGTMATPTADTVVQLLTGAFTDTEQITLKAARIGLDVGHPHGLVVLCALPGSSTPPLWALAKEVAGRVGGVVVRVPSDATHLTVVVPIDGASWSSTLSSLRGVTASAHVVMVGRRPTVGAAGLHDAYVELIDLLPLAPGLLSAGSVVDSRDLQPYWVLAHLPEEVRDTYVERVFGDVFQLERRRAEALLATASALSQSRWSVAQASHSLGCSRQTMYQRIVQLDELLGTRSGDAGAWLDLGLFLLPLSRRGYFLARARTRRRGARTRPGP